MTLKLRWLNLLACLLSLTALSLVTAQTPTPKPKPRPRTVTAKPTPAKPVAAKPAPAAKPVAKPSTPKPLPAKIPAKKPPVTKPTPPVARRPQVTKPTPANPPVVRRPRTTTPTTPPPLPEIREVRALWVVRTTLTTPEKIRRMVAQAADNGFNTLIVQIRGRGDAYYQSRWEPRAEDLRSQPATFDPLALVLNEARRRGLRVHGWINTHLIASAETLPTSPQHIFQTHPEWLAVPREVASDLYNMSPDDPRYRARIIEWTKRNPEQTEGLFTSPANPAVQEHIYSVWLDVLEKYALDGLHFDFVRYSNPAFDFSRTAMERFRGWLEPHLTSEERRTLIEATRVNALAATELFPAQFADFQREQITSLVERISVAVRKRRSNMTLSAAVFANAQDAYANRYQDWQRWLALGYLDVVCPMAYTTDTNTFRAQIETAANAAHNNGARVWAGIGAYRMPVSGTLEKIQAARDLRADGVILFSYDFAAAPSSPNNPQGDYLQQVSRLAWTF